MPFRFEPAAEQRSYVDQSNGLRLRVHQWPEYNYSISIQPLSDAQANAWPLSKRAYFEFLLIAEGDWVDELLRISAAFAYVPFERDYPGRTEELLNAVLPLLGYVYSHDAGRSVPAIVEIPEELCSDLIQRRKYVWRAR